MRETREAQLTLERKACVDGGSVHQASEPASSRQEVGGELIDIPVCNDFLKKYQACVASTGPNVKESAEEGFETMRKQLISRRKHTRGSAMEGDMRKQMENSCKEGLTRMREMFEVFGCSSYFKDDSH